MHPSSPRNPLRLPLAGRRFSFGLAVAGVCIAALGVGCAGPGDAKPRAVGVTRSPLASPKPNLSRPVATPVLPIARTSSRMTVAVRPLGAVPFDGLTLPLTSPSGRFIAAQHGPTPSWDALLAAPTPEGAKLPVQLAISAFEVLPPDRVQSGREALMPLPSPRAEAQQPVLIGRSCDDAGYLVESPRAADNSRWIGHVDWLTGGITWLVGGDESPDAAPTVACFGTFGPSGQFAFCRAGAPGEAFDLVVRSAPKSATGERVVHPEPGCTFACPLFTSDPDRVYVFSVSSLPGARLALLALRTSPSGTPEGAPSTLPVVGRMELDVPASIASAFQCSLVLQTPWPMLEGGSPSARVPRGIPMVAPETVSMQWFDPERGVATGLAKGTLGAVPALAMRAGATQCRGLLLGAARELVFQSLTDDSSPTFGGDAAVIQGAFLPRITSSKREGAAVYLLLSPPMPTAAAEVGVSELLALPEP